MSHQEKAKLTGELLGVWVSELETLELSLLQQMQLLAAVAVTMARITARDQGVDSLTAIDCAVRELARMMRAHRAYEAGEAKRSSA